MPHPQTHTPRPLQQRKLDTLKRRKSRALSGVADTAPLDGNFEELITKLTSGEAFKDFGQGKKRAKRVSSNSALIHAWNQISRDRIAVSEANELIKPAADNKKKS